MTAIRYRYQTFTVGEFDVHLRTLWDTQQFHDPDGIADKLGIRSGTWSLFGVIWTASEILAQLMVDVDISSRRILEVGCGMALASHVLNQRHADITAMDYHPDAGKFLADNVLLNRGRPIPFVRSGWGDENQTDLDLGKFDLIIGSDVLYEPIHSSALPPFIDRHGTVDCEVMIVDQDRGVISKFSKEMISRGFDHESTATGLKDQFDIPYVGKLHRYHRIENRAG